MSAVDLPPVIVTAKTRPFDPEEARIILPETDQVLSGWTSMRITRGIERCPSDFVFQVTDYFPADDIRTVAKAGDPCEVYIGRTQVVSGYIDRLSASIEGRQHGIMLMGRGKCQDLVDCSAERDGQQFKNMTVAQIAADLAKPYGINVKMLADPGAVVPQFNLIWGETPWEIIERICRIKGLLAFEDESGSLVLTQAGTEQHASGLKQGVNVERAQAVMAMDQRFSEYRGYALALNVFAELGDAWNNLGSQFDPNVPRNRKKFIVQEAGDTGDVIRQRLAWECNRRWGRGNALVVTTDSWRDSSGALYTPNKLIEVELPALKVDKERWLVGDVTYRRDASGTHCDLVIMPAPAFTPEPITFMPLPRELGQP